MLRDRGLRRTTPEQTAESLLRGAWASAVLEGSTSNFEETRDGEGDEIAQAALRVNTQMLALVPVLAQSPLQAFARLHSLAGKGDLAPDSLGRPASDEAAARLNSLSKTILASTETPAMIVAALVHADLATSGAFPSHNGIVARAAERLVLVARGVDPASLVVPEAGHLTLRPQYESNLRAYAGGSKAGVQAWLLYASEAMAKGAERSPLRS